MRLNKIYSWALALSMVLCAYSFSFLPSLSFAYIVFIFFAVLFIARLIMQKRFSVDIYLSFACLLIALTLITVALTELTDNKRMIVYIMRTFVWALLLSNIVLDESFDRNRFYKICYIIALIATMYLFVQIVGYSFLHIKLPNTLSFGNIKLSNEDVEYSTSYRPSSFFMEPSYYGTYILCTLALVLFDRVKTKNRIVAAIFLSLGIVFSTSSGGIFLMVALYFMFFLRSMSGKELSVSKLIIAFIGIGLFFIIYFNYESIFTNFGPVGNAIISAIKKLDYAKTSSRLGGSYDYLSSLNGLSTIIGCGIGNEYLFLNIDIKYMNSMTRFIIQSGYLGLSFFIIFLLSLFKRERKNMLALFFLLLYIVKCLTGGAMFAIPGIFILSFFVLESVADKQRRNEVIINEYSIYLKSVG